MAKNERQIHGMESRHLGGNGAEIATAETAALHSTAYATITLHRAVEFHDEIESQDKRFFSSMAETDIHHHNLPHWGQRDTIVFITFRLADSMPTELLSRWHEEREAWLAVHLETWDETTAQEYAHEFTGRIEKWLDAGHGKCILSQNNCNAIVSDALEYFNGVRYVLHSYIVMPNHVHVLMALSAYDDLPGILHSWKSFTAKKICRAIGYSGPIWQRDYFDRIVRSEEHYRHCIDYIRKNERQMKGMEGRMESRHLGGYGAEIVAAGTAALHMGGNGAEIAAAGTAALHVGGDRPLEQGD